MFSAQQKESCCMHLSTRQSSVTSFIIQISRQAPSLPLAQSGSWFVLLCNSKLTLLKTKVTQQQILPDWGSSRPATCLFLDVKLPLLSMECGGFEESIVRFTFSSVPCWDFIYFAAGNSPLQYIAASRLYSCLYKLGSTACNPLTTDKNLIQLPLQIIQTKCEKQKYQQLEVQ